MGMPYDYLFFKMSKDRSLELSRGYAPTPVVHVWSLGWESLCEIKKLHKWWMLPCCFLAVHVCLQTYCLILSCVWHLFGLWAGASMHTCAVSIVKKNWPINFAVTPQR